MHNKLFLIPLFLLTSASLLSACTGDDISTEDGSYADSDESAEGIGTAQQASISGNGLVSRWLLNGDADDLFGTNHGSYDGSFDSGCCTQGFRSGGPGELVVVPDSNSLDLTEYTIVARFRMDAINGFNMPVVWKGNSTGTTNTSPYSLVVWGTNSPNAGRIFVSNGNGSNHQVIGSNATLFPGDCVHVAVTADGDRVNIYVDGELDASVPQTIIPSVNAHPLQIGSIQNPIYANYFNGTIDDVRLYDRALTPIEVKHTL